MASTGHAWRRSRTSRGRSLSATAADDEGPTVALDLRLDAARQSADEGVPTLREDAARFATTLLRVRARGTGLPPSRQLALPVVTVDLQGCERFRAGRGQEAELLQLAAEAAHRGERVRFKLARHDTQRAGAAALDPRNPRDAAPCRAGRITLNLPAAARRAGRGNVEGFLRHCDRLVDLASEGHRTRRELLAQSGASAGGSLAPLVRGGRGREPLVDLARARWTIGFVGLNEALASIGGFEIHELDEAGARLAQRVLRYLAVRVAEAERVARWTPTSRR